MNLQYDIHIVRIQNNNLGEVLKIDWHYRLKKDAAHPAGNTNIVN